MPDFPATLGFEGDTSNDLMIAQMLQHEFDKEYDHDVKLREAKFNADSKGDASVCPRCGCTT